MSKKKYSAKYIVEKFYPSVISIIVTVVAICYKDKFNNTEKMIDQMCDNAISLSVTLAGFFLTILTLIKSITSRRMRFVLAGGGTSLLYGYIKSAIQCNILLLLSSFLVKYIEHRKVLLFYIKGLNYIDTIYIALFIYTILISVRFTQLFISLLTDPDKANEVHASEAIETEEME
ncbi:hypothetical protein MKQ70_16555 [Chitinophaga sedimenti]|uniref:hypothetical protein n=1 Tax=Chitinophaga sedimenti TaxID=2033606 RepID=UPI0020068BA8|nr:hypothetical protein [Chitinophaga sedimenti]MCK7556540.1 hypothetical protein [Chitinophaga sedimenti]